MSSKPSNFGLRYVQDLATKHCINITKTYRNKLIHEISRKTKNVDIKNSTEDIVNVEVKKYKRITLERKLSRLVIKMSMALIINDDYLELLR